MDETLRKLDELALELKLLTTEMREVGPRCELKWDLQAQLEEAKQLADTL